MREKLERRLQLRDWYIDIEGDDKHATIKHWDTSKIPEAAETKLLLDFDEIKKLHRLLDRFIKVQTDMDGVEAYMRSTDPV